MEHYYLHIPENHPENRDVIFYVDGIHEITALDVPIATEAWQQFHEEEAEHPRRLKENLPESGGLFDYLEEYTPEFPPLPPSETEVLQEQLVQQQLATAEAIEKQEMDKIEMQLALAEAIEMLAGGGE
ncbi:hypothetical protein [Eubacterium sp.]|uniref:hypothetical protein n=1 Tax=Eubacterium sp. TaxID=142586 RepID=UPI0026DF292A|nr:hypothetical protein [Eubacterium sp.]MDO5434132.1 hypothetical protein [Eubacterium sp.]